MEIKDELIAELLKDYKKPEDLIGKDGLLREITKRLIEKAMDAELTGHLGYEKNDAGGNGNSRNGRGKKTLITAQGKIPIEPPRDRDGTFEPQIVRKRERRFDGFDDKIMAMYARGMTVRNIQGYLEDMYGVDVSTDLISSVTESVWEDVVAWQNRALDSVYPILYLDAIRVKIRENAKIVNKAIYLVMGINMTGAKEVLGMWVAQNEGAKFWMMVLTDLRNRGLQDVFIACVDGLTGFSDAISSIYPDTEVQQCIVHLVRNSLRYVSWKDRKKVAAGLRNIYNSPTEEAAKQELSVFRKNWDDQYPTIADMWERNWTGIMPFMAYPAEIRRVIYTTNAIESLQSSFRKVLRQRGSFPNDESALKLLYLSLEIISRKWTRPIHNWKRALNQFAILFGERFPNEAI